MEVIFHATLSDLQQSAQDLSALGARAFKALEEAMTQGHVSRHRTLSKVWRDLENQGFVHIRETFDIAGTHYTITPSLFGEEAAEYLWEMRQAHPITPGA